MRREGLPQLLRRSAEPAGMFKPKFALTSDTSARRVFARMFTALLPLIVFVVGCSDNECGAGYARVGAACVALMTDAGVESCNGRDDDADGNVDETDPSAGTPCGSGVGVCTIGVLACLDGRLACNGESGTDETCNNVDDDCDGRVDESLTRIFFQDADEDGFGNSESVCEACESSQCIGEGRWVATGGDCDDTCDSCCVGALEVCDTVDNDCDGAVDEGTQVRVYADADGDGFGAGEGVVTCLERGAPPRGFVLRDGDCADEDARANPDASAMFTTRIHGALDEALDFDFDCDGREERRHEACPSCQNGACWHSVVEPLIEGDPACGTPGRAQRSDRIDRPGRTSLCVQGQTYRDAVVACR